MLGSAAVAGPGDDPVRYPYRWVSAQSEYRMSRMFDDGPSRRWNLGATVTDVTFANTYGGWYTEATVSYVRPNGAITYSEPDGLSVRALPAEPHLCGDVTIRSPGGYLSGGVRTQVGRKDQRELGLSAYCRPFRGLAVGVERSRQHPIPFRTELYYADEGGALTWSVPADVWRYELRVSPRPWCTFSSQLTEVELSRGRTPEDHPSHDGYLATLDGTWRDDLYRIEVQVPWSSILSGEYREISTDLRLLAFDDGNRFAHFGVAELDASWWEFRFTRGHLLLSIQKGEASGDLAGAVDAWPFIHGLARFIGLIGQRRHFICEGRLDWKNIYGENSWSLGRRLHLLVGLRYLHLEPDASYKTWQSKWLGMGVVDLRHGRLDIRSAHLVHLRVTPQINYRHWRLDISAGQWAPLSVSRWDEEDDESTGSSSSSDNDHPHVGFDLSAALSYSL